MKKLKAWHFHYKFPESDPSRSNLNKDSQKDYDALRILKIQWGQCL